MNAAAPGGSLSAPGPTPGGTTTPGGGPAVATPGGSSEVLPGMLAPPGMSGAPLGGSPMGGGQVAPPTSVDCSLAGSVAISVPWGNAVNSQPPEWYATAEAMTLAENVLYYQNPDRGWPKSIDMSTRNSPRNAESTIDNNATTTQVEFLARVFSATGCAQYGAGARNALEYLLEAQYDNGGWPQVYPDPGGYQAHITYNDNAMVRVLEVLRRVAGRQEPYAFAEDSLVTRADAAVQLGIQCILDTQIEIDGTKLGWCAQHDEVTLLPAQARTYELPSLSGSEGANLFRFLMSIENPSAEVREAIQGAAAWFESVKIEGIRIDSIMDASQPEGEDRIVVEDPTAPLLWARFYELGTNRPIFSSRCEVPECEDDPFFMVRYSLAEIDNERRVGYAWYGSWPRNLLATTYPEWRARWAP